MINRWIDSQVHKQIDNGMDRQISIMVGRQCHEKVDR